MKRLTALVLLSVLAASVLLGGCAESEQYRPRLFLSLPDSCNTPDGMTLDPGGGNVILACPNFNDTKYPGALMKIDSQNRVTKFFDLPPHPETGKAGPMGLDFGPDGNLYVADNQYFSSKDYKSRLIRVNVRDGKAVSAEVAVDGFKLSNAVIWKGNDVYVSDTYFDLPDKPGMSGIYRISLDEMKKGTVRLKPGAADPHLLATFRTQPLKHRGNELAGADGLAFDSQGNLYAGNFGDGVLSKITFDKDGKVASNTVLVKSPRMTCVDGIFCDLKTDRIYVADSERNAIHVVTPDGKWTTLWENGDTDGSTGLLDQPCETLLRGDELLIANFDMPFPGLKNSKYDKHHTLSVIRLGK